jgi:transcriptional regulator with XRE-family HTH domain
MQKLICEKLKFLKEKHGYSQQTVADALSMSQNTYSLLETGKTKLDIERLILIAEFYNVPAHDLLDTPPRKKSNIH